MIRPKLYISLPMKNIPDSEIRAKIISMNWKYALDYAVYDPVSINNSNTCEPECLGKDIEVLLKCDTVLFCKGWWHHRGCLLEFAASILYGKKKIFE